MSEQVTLTINGKEVSGDRETIGRMLLNTGDIYISEREGPILVQNMTNYHIKNALRKVYIKWIEFVFINSNMSELVPNLRKGPTGYDQFAVLFTELVKRNDTFKW